MPRVVKMDDDGSKEPPPNPPNISGSGETPSEAAARRTEAYIREHIGADHAEQFAHNFHAKMSKVLVDMTRSVEDLKEPLTVLLKMKGKLPFLGKDIKRARQANSFSLKVISRMSRSTRLSDSSKAVLTQAEAGAEVVGEMIEQADVAMQRLMDRCKEVDNAMKHYSLRLAQAMPPPNFLSKEEIGLLKHQAATEKELTAISVLFGDARLEDFPVKKKPKTTKETPKTRKRKRDE